MLIVLRKDLYVHEIHILKVELSVSATFTLWT